MPDSSRGHLHACHQCDALHTVPALAEGERALCSRCGAKLTEHRVRGLQRGAGFAIGAAVLFAIANLFPFVVVEVAGRRNSVDLVGSVGALYETGSPWLGAAVAIFIIGAPGLIVAGLLYLYLPLLRGRVLAGSKLACRWVYGSGHWSMVEVFLLGTLISLIKLAGMATIQLGVAFWAFAALMVCLIAGAAAVDRLRLWELIDDRDRVRAGGRRTGTAAGHGLASCHDCGHLQSLADGHDCHRCHAPLHLRKPDSVQRTAALTVASAVLYIPANVYPIMLVDGFGGQQNSTILGGVITFWHHGSYFLALIIFIASVAIPLLKLLALSWLCLQAMGLRPGPLRATRIYRLTEIVGRWSMVDVFVVAILVAAVRLGSLMTINPGPAAVAFAGVVVLTMLAAMAFDPRLIWDRAEERNPARHL